MKKRLLFYSSVKSLELFKTQKFYQIDIALLEDLGYDVWLSNRIFDSLLFGSMIFYFLIFIDTLFLRLCSQNALGKKLILPEALIRWTQIMLLLLVIEFKCCFLNYVIGSLILV